MAQYLNSEDHALFEAAIEVLDYGVALEAAGKLTFGTYEWALEMETTVSRIAPTWGVDVDDLMDACELLNAHELRDANDCRNGPH